jgi:hypothetical protein
VKKCSQSAICVAPSLVMSLVFQLYINHNYFHCAVNTFTVFFLHSSGMVRLLFLWRILFCFTALLFVMSVCTSHSVTAHTHTHTHWHTHTRAPTHTHTLARTHAHIQLQFILCVLSYDVVFVNLYRVTVLLLQGFYHLLTFILCVASLRMASRVAGTCRMLVHIKCFTSVY